MSEIQRPRVTVAAIVQRDDAFLFVEEEIRGQRRLNQPAGHLEPGESLLEGMRREALEETGYSVEADFLLGVYQWHAPHSGKRYVRFAFGAHIVGHDPGAELDEGIIGPRWYSVDELRQPPVPLRGPLVLRNVEDYLAGRRFPLDLISTLPPL